MKCFNYLVICQQYKLILSIPFATMSFGAVDKMSRWQPKSRSTMQLSFQSPLLHRHHVKKLTRVQICHLRQLLRIKWEDRVPDVGVLSRAGTISVEAQSTEARLRWTRHIRIPLTRLVIDLFYDELCQGKRRRGTSWLQYKYVVKRDTKIFEIDSANTILL